MTILKAILNTIIIFGASILVMIYGWGLEPKSWGVVIGGYLGIAVIGVILGS